MKKTSFFWQFRFCCYGVSFLANLVAAMVVTTSPLEDLGFWYMPVLVITSIVVGPVFVALIKTMQTMNPFISDTEWDSPNNYSNPFDLQAPLSIIHFGSLLGISSGIGIAVAGILRLNLHLLGIGLATVFAGIGFLLGVFLFKNGPNKGVSRKSDGDTHN